MNQRGRCAPSQTGADMTAPTASHHDEQQLDRMQSW